MIRRSISISIFLFIHLIALYAASPVYFSYSPVNQVYDYRKGNNLEIIDDYRNINGKEEIEKLIVGIYSNYLMNRANQLNILRKVAKPGYDISFLITNFTLENYKKEDIIDFIIEFIQDFVKEVTDMKMTVNSQSRYATTYLMEHVKV